MEEATQEQSIPLSEGLGIFGLKLNWFSTLIVEQFIVTARRGVHTGWVLDWHRTDRGAGEHGNGNIAGQRGSGIQTKKVIPC